MPHKINKIAAIFVTLIISDKKDYPSNNTLIKVTPISTGNVAVSGSWVTVYSQPNDASSAAAYSDKITGSVKNMARRSINFVLIGDSIPFDRHFTINWL
jgi:hypothetical protein